MIYVVFNPNNKVAYCRREHPFNFEKFASIVRCRLYEYEHNIRKVGYDYEIMAQFGGLKNLRFALAEPDEERPWPYTKFTSYRYDHDMQLWIDTHPRAIIYPIQTEEEYKEELKKYRKM